MPPVVCPHCGLRFANDNALSARILTCPGCLGDLALPDSPVAGRPSAAAVSAGPAPPRRVRWERPSVGVLPLVGIAAAVILVVVFLADESPQPGARNAEQDAVLYARQVRASDPDELLYLDVELESGCLVVTVSEDWLDMPYKVRHRMAVKLWHGWAMLHSPDDLPAAPIKFVNDDGHAVGGTQTWGAVWVIPER